MRISDLSFLRLAVVAVGATLGWAAGSALAHEEHGVLFVAKQGSDEGDCRDSDRPCGSIEYAIRNAGKGDRILVGAGIYAFRPDAPGEGMQLIGDMVGVQGGYDYGDGPAGSDEASARTFLYGPAPHFRSRLEERGITLVGTPSSEDALVRLAQLQSEPATLYVSDTGVDSGSCIDPAAPCATIVYALSFAASGDIIAVADGSYVLTQDLLEEARGRGISLQGGYAPETGFALRTGAESLSFVIGPSFEERQELLQSGFTLLQDRKFFDIAAALPTAGASAVASAPAQCVGGSAAGHPCKGIDFIARIALSGFSSQPTSANDIWGFVDLNDRREYAIIGLRNGTAVVDVTDPANPAEIGTIPGLSTTWRDVKVLQTFDAAANRWKAYAYVTADAVAQGFQIIDLTGLPTTISLAATINEFASAHNIYMANIDYASGRPLAGATPYAYVLGSNLQGGAFRILGLANPTAPVTVTQSPLGHGYTHDASSMLISDARTADCAPGHSPCELLIDYNETAVDFWDVTDKAAPEKLSSLAYANAEYTHSGWWSADMRYIFIQDELDERDAGLNTRVIVVDLANLKSPTVAAIWTGPTRAIDHNGFTLGDEYYMSNYRRGLTVLDVSNPAAPVEKYFFDTFISPADDSAAFNGAWGTFPFLPSGTILVSDIEGGLFLLKKSSGDAPRAGDIAFVWADQPTAANYSPNATYAHNPAGPVTIARTGVGAYAVRFLGFGGEGLFGGNVQSTAYGALATQCKVMSWSSGGADFVANIRCHRADGSAVDGRFTLLVTWPR